LKYLLQTPLAELMALSKVSKTNSFDQMLLQQRLLLWVYLMQNALKPLRLCIGFCTARGCFKVQIPDRHDFFTNFRRSGIQPSLKRHPQAFSDGRVI